MNKGDPISPQDIYKFSIPGEEQNCLKLIKELYFPELDHITVPEDSGQKVLIEKLHIKENVDTNKQLIVQSLWFRKKPFFLSLHTIEDSYYWITDTDTYVKAVDYLWKLRKSVEVEGVIDPSKPLEELSIINLLD